ncbi:MAG: DUF2141 domain-containing protein [Sphingomonadales bacterium]
MRSLLLITFFMAVSTRMTAHAQPTPGVLQIEVSGARNNKGVVLCSVFTDAQGYPDNAAMALYKARLPFRNGRVLFEVTSLAAGQYAVAILHDENEDGKMNTSTLGLPKEGYGFSNNVMGLFGPPSFAKAAVTIKEGARKSISLELRY